MKKDIISKKTREEFCFKLQDHFGGTYITKLFDSEDIMQDKDFDPEDGSPKRAMVKQYYQSLDFSDMNDVRKLLGVYEEVLKQVLISVENWNKNFNPSDFPDNANEPEREFKQLINLLKRDGFRYENGRIIQISGSSATIQLKNVIEEFDFEYIHKHIKRMEESIETDTDVTIGEAKSLIETCCKTILKEKGVTIDQNWDIGQLAKCTLKELKLTPDDIEDNKKVTKAAKQILGSLSAIVQGMAELRNIYGSGHGKDGEFRGLPPRYAKLASGAASTFVTFLFETYKERI